MGRAAANHHFDHEFPNLKFKKTGAQISETTKQLIDFMKNEEITKLRGELDTLCKDRQVDVNEALEAADDNEAHLNMSAKYTNGPGAPRGNAQLLALQTDLDRIKRLVFDITYKERSIENLKRVRNNLEQDRSFDLDYSEIRNLGF